MSSVDHPLHTLSRAFLAQRGDPRGRLITQDIDKVQAAGRAVRMLLSCLSDVLIFGFLEHQLFSIYIKFSYTLLSTRKEL